MLPFSSRAMLIAVGLLAISATAIATMFTGSEDSGSAVESERAEPYLPPVLALGYLLYGQEVGDADGPQYLPFQGADAAPGLVVEQAG